MVNQNQIKKRQTLEISSALPDQGYIRIWQIVGDKRRGIPPIIPVCRTTFLNGCKSGKYPKPVKLGERTTAWRVSDIKAMLDRLECAA